MAAEVHQFTAMIPAGTPMAALATIDLPISNYQIDSIDLEVPPGPSGLMGFYLARSGQQWIPYEAGEFIVWDDRFRSWQLNDQPTGGGWQVVGYNFDEYDHEIVVRFHVNAISVAMTPAKPSITIVSSPITTPMAIL